MFDSLPPPKISTVHHRFHRSEHLLIYGIFQQVQKFVQPTSPHLPASTHNGESHPQHPHPYPEISLKVCHFLDFRKSRLGEKPQLAESSNLSLVLELPKVLAKQSASVR